MDNAAWNLPPLAIEEKSFAIIDSEAGPHAWSPASWSVIRRLIHASADFEYVQDAVISPGAIEAGIRAVQSGPLIVTDTKMALNGVNRQNFKDFGLTLSCLVDDARTLAIAKEKGLTRSQVAVDLAFDELIKPSQSVIWVIGNAPTALYRLLERLQDPASPRPSLLIALPVGFVNAYESKRDLALTPNLNFITNKSRKGGSNVAAAAVNALAKLALKK
ncbi:MAG: precorrin-8X methylmutase [Deltaproteobacteria bacterium]|jgi:precorrin-8X/cobalt-precorrin-8 methylmutase|nr:precorrin-8X methylmutase [Deltaproteobacteria bacterium]